MFGVGMTVGVFAFLKSLRVITVDGQLADTRPSHALPTIGGGTYLRKKHKGSLTLLRRASWQAKPSSSTTC